MVRKVNLPVFEEWPIRVSVHVVIPWYPLDPMLIGYIVFHVLKCLHASSLKLEKHVQAC